MDSWQEFWVHVRKLKSYDLSSSKTQNCSRNVLLCPSRVSEVQRNSSKGNFPKAKERSKLIVLDSKTPTKLVQKTISWQEMLLRHKWTKNMLSPKCHPESHSREEKIKKGLGRMHGVRDKCCSVSFLLSLFLFLISRLGITI